MASRRVSAAIFGLVAFFVVALLAARFDALRQDRAMAVARAESDMGSLARVAEQYAQRVFETANLVTSQVAARVRELGGVAALGASPGAHRWLRDLSGATAGDYLIVADAEGRPVATSFADQPLEVLVADLGWFRTHAGTGAETHIGGATHSRVTGEQIFTYSRALRRPDGTLDGVVQVGVRTAFFQRIGGPGQYGDRTAIGLFDSEGKVLARTGLQPWQGQVSLHGSPVLAEAQEWPEGVLHLTLPFDPAERIVAFRRVSHWPVLVTASLPLEDALAPWWQAVRSSIELIGAGTLGLLLLALLAIRLARREAHAREALAGANAALREAATGLETRVAERTRDLAASEMRFRVIFDSTFQLIALLDRAGLVQEVNGTALRFLGLAREEVVGRRLVDLPCWPDPATRVGLGRAIAAAARGVARHDELVTRAADGRPAPLQVALRPVRNAEGRIAWLVAEAHDLTELKAAEAKLRESQKMEVLGQLTGGVAHDFNNLLMVVLGNLGLLRKRLPEDPRLLRLLDGAQQGAERGAALTQRMLAFARRQDLQPAPVDLAALVRGLIPLLERSAGPTVQLASELPEGLPPAMVDANQLELALLNLVVNARDAMPEGGRVLIGLATAEAPSPGAPAGVLPGRYLRLTLRDSGIGMEAATLARATEPFFTTKGIGHGSGLGLSMVQGLAQQSGGGLRLTSRPGEGTTAEIWLPRAEPAAEPANLALPERGAGAGQPRHVLVVDDDPLVAAGSAMMLEDLGHSVSVAASAEEALRALERDPGIGLVLTDHAMPGMTGLELAERLRQERPKLPVVLATGYAELPASIPAWLPRLDKPYRQEELSRLVRALTRAEAA